MKYSEIRNNIKSGDLIALTHKSWCSLYDIQIQAVRTFTQSEYSHVCVAWVVAGRVFVIEAVEPKVRIMPLSNMNQEGFYWIPTTKPMSETELEFGLAAVGIGAYSKVQAIAAQLNMLDIGADDKWECAELTIMMRQLSGQELGGKATPSAVVAAAQNSGAPVYLISKS